MTASRYLITGATGFVGGHLAEACKARGYSVRTIARPASDTAFLDRLGVEIVRGDLTDADVVNSAVSGCDAVVHCAAKVGDWGPVTDYRPVNVESLRTLLDACKSTATPLHRFVHLSSLGVYSFRHHYGTDETEPLPARHFDGYTQTKVEAEALVREHAAALPTVILRPGFIYGPRERAFLPKTVDRIRSGKLPYFGNGRRAMNCIYVGNLVDAIFLAVDQAGAVGETFNLTDGEAVSKRRFLETIADGLGLPRPDHSYPLWWVRILAWGMETEARLKGATKAPKLTRARVKFLGMNLDFSIGKARRVLGYQPRVGFEDGMKTTTDWYKQYTV